MSHALMLAWDASWLPKNLPVWFKRALRARFRATTPRGPFNPHAQFESNLWDHWGTVVRGKTHAVVTQPYGKFEDHHREACQLAQELDCKLVAKPGGPWHPSTSYFEFVPFGPDADALPDAEGGRSKYAFRTMKVGDCITVPKSDAVRAYSYASGVQSREERAGRPRPRYKRETLRAAGLVRFWRVA